MKYPRYTKEQSMGCKLLDQDIEDIKTKYSKGITQAELSREYGVSKNAIRYHIDDEYRKRTCDTRSSKPQPKKTSEYWHNLNKRRREIKGDLLREFYRVNYPWSYKKDITDPKKLKARHIVGYAIKSGRIIKCPCCVCGSKVSQAHHDDYSKPLEVVWLCTTHHAEIHRGKDAKTKRS
jgi:hypothetical protein